MHISNIQVENFRLLEEADLNLEKLTTVIVGRNNSGKTSLTELFRRLLDDSTPKFQLEDFSLSVHDSFWKAYVLNSKGTEDKDVRNTLPLIKVKLSVEYDMKATSLGSLGDFIIDLNPDCTTANIIIKYQIKDGEINSFFENFDFSFKEDGDTDKEGFFKAIKELLPRYYTHKVLAVDPNDENNQKELSWSALQRLIQSGFINAQRGLDDITHRDQNVLGKVLESLFETATDSQEDSDLDIVQRLQGAVDDIQSGIDDKFSSEVENLLPTFSLFGYPGLSDPNLRTETNLDVEKLLKDHTRVHYAGINGINLPESYNGLGARNLIYILLKLLEFFKAHMAKEAKAGVHLVFIEEPEVHLHPQMQEVFIQKIGEIASVFAKKFSKETPWPVQFIVTTHSSHLANKASFRSMRYFLTRESEENENIRSTEIKDLRKGLKQTKKEVSEFLHKYLTLTRCDLLFADKAILIEGTCERILLPEMIKRVENGQSEDSNLSSQFVAIIEIGGAYAHLFFELLEFLELKTLIITDLDSTKENENKRQEACPVSEGESTSNSCIKEWFSKKDISPEELLSKPEEEKIRGNLRIAYQIPESKNTGCGRTLEDAFILANQTLFKVGSDLLTDSQALSIAKEYKKTEFALKYAIEKQDWSTPKYINEGLKWLADNPPKNIEKATLPESKPPATKRSNKKTT